MVGDVIKKLYRNPQPVLVDTAGTWLRLNRQEYDPGLYYPLFTYNERIQIIKVMTSATAPSPQVVTASSETSATYAAWRAFALATASTWRSAANTFPGAVGNQWVQIDLGAPHTCVAYGLAQYDALTTGNAPSEWKVLGSNDNSTWTELDHQQGWASTAWPAINNTMTLLLPAAGTYRYWRYNVLKTCGATICALRNFELYAQVVPDSGASLEYVKVA